jgi:uroporphyrin-III C-methyltransferase/precorrin-2 dehydrogenase/sirohydrochlorin ferrochelatase
MGVETAPAIAAVLLGNGRSPDTPVGIVCDGSTPTQRTIRTTLEALPRTISEEAVRPPAVFVIGDVVDLDGRQVAADADDAELD